MANRAMARKVLKQHKARKEEIANMRIAKYPRAYLFQKEPLIFSFLTKHKEKCAMPLHIWGPEKPFKTPVVCKRAAYGEDCKVCKKEGRWGNLKPDVIWGYLIFHHNAKPYIDKRTKKKKPAKFIKVLLVDQGGRDEVNFENLNDAAAEKTFMKSVWQWKQKGKIKKITPEAKASLRTKGIVPKEVRDEIEELGGIDGHWGHIANVVADFDYDQFDVPEIKISRDDIVDEDTDSKSKYAGEDDEDDDDGEDTYKKKKSKSSVKKKKRASDDDDDEEESEDDDDDDESDDDEEEEKPKRKSKKPVKKTSKKKVAKDDDEDEEEESEDDEDEDEEEEDEKPKRKKKVPAKPVKKGKTKKAHWSDHSDDDDDESEDDDDSDDEDDEDDE